MSFDSWKLLHWLLKDDQYTTMKCSKEVVSPSFRTDWNVVVYAKASLLKFWRVLTYCKKKELSRFDILSMFLYFCRESNLVRNIWYSNRLLKWGVIYFLCFHTFMFIHVYHNPSRLVILSSLKCQCCIKHFFQHIRSCIYGVLDLNLRIIIEMANLSSYYQSWHAL